MSYILISKLGAKGGKIILKKANVKTPKPSRRKKKTNVFSFLGLVKLPRDGLHKLPGFRWGHQAFLMFFDGFLVVFDSGLQWFLMGF